MGDAHNSLRRRDIGDFRVPTHGGPPVPRSVTWEPTGDGKKVISLADNHILLWDLQESSGQAVVSDTLTVFIFCVF